MLGIATNWTTCSTASSTKKIDWEKTFALPEVPPTLGSPDRQCYTYDRLKEVKGQITVQTMYKFLRLRKHGYHPATADAHRNICIHAGPQDNRWWQADGGMVTDVSERGALIWVTGTSGNCVSIFKPVFMGINLPEIGTAPTEHFDPSCLWWKHELLHHRAMADFDNLVPEIRRDFDALENEFVAESGSMKKSTLDEKRDFMEYCFHKSLQTTET